MNAAQIKSGKPQVDGRYVAFVQCQAAAARDWIEPLIVTWANDRWHTSFIPVSRILGWMGPIPVLKVADLAEQAFGDDVVPTHFETHGVDKPILRAEYDL